MKLLINSFDRQFSGLHRRNCEIVAAIPTEKIYQPLRQSNQHFASVSCGEYVLRSAGAVEQTFGGITSKLWDDPFEWTLPEELSTKAKILEYLAEVEATRLKGFAYLASDEDLLRTIPAPEKLRSIFDILLETVARAEHFQGRAFAVFQMFSDENPPKL
ncbi:MAG TPA: hypothetical protein VNI84_01760 [Pyrinomonadaceae bacterium]|nr:hypothetical protein [Pyrinomonadaceae bacterium]